MTKCFGTIYSDNMNKKGRGQPDIKTGHLTLTLNQQKLSCGILQKTYRILSQAFKSHFKVQVISGRPPGTANQ